MSLTDAVLVRLRAAVTPVYDGEVPVDEKGRPLEQRYAVLYPATPLRADDDKDLTATRADRHDARFQVTSVGMDRNQVEWVATRCRDALMGDPLTAEGWEIGAATHTSSSPIRRDKDIPGDPVFYAVDSYLLPATT